MTRSALLPAVVVAALLAATAHAAPASATSLAVKAANPAGAALAAGAFAVAATAPMAPALAAGAAATVSAAATTVTIATTPTAPPRKGIGYGDACQARPSPDGWLIYAGGNGEALYACKPNAAMTVTPIPRRIAAFLVPTVCDVSKPVSSVAYDADRVVTYCTFIGADKVPAEWNGHKLTVAQP